MRSTLNKIALTAILTFATISTTNCSSDDGEEPGGGGLTGLPAKAAQQVYKVVYSDYDGSILEYGPISGNSDVAIIYNKSEFDYIDCYNGSCTCYKDHDNGVECTEEEYEQYDTIPAGKIENGKITLNLPSSIDSKYLEPFGDACNEEGVQNPCIDELKNTLGTKPRFYATGLSCRLSIYADEYERDGVRYSESAVIIYLQGAGKIKYNFIRTGGGITDYTYDYNFSKGWNTWYGHSEDSIQENGEFYDKNIHSTDPSIITGTLKWICR